MFNWMIYTLVYLFTIVNTFSHRPFSNQKELDNPRLHHFKDEYESYYPHNYPSEEEMSNFERLAFDRELTERQLRDNPNSQRIEDEFKPDIREIELKFTNLSAESDVSNYSRKLSNSKIFKFKSPIDAYVSAILVSTTEFYHPQFFLSKIRDREFESLPNLNYNNKFLFSKDGEYVVEVGNDKEIKTDPFQDIASGSFTLIFSSNCKTISEALIQETMKLFIWGFQGPAVFKQSEELSLYHDTIKNLNHGILNYSITPYYSKENQKLSLYYHNGSTKFSNKIQRASTLDIKCNRNLVSSKTFTGEEPKPLRYLFKCESKNICDIFDLID